MKVPKTGNGGVIHAPDLGLFRQAFVWLKRDFDWHRDDRKRRLSRRVGVSQGDGYVLDGRGA